MPIEDTINALTAAVEALTAAITASTRPSPSEDVYQLTDKGRAEVIAAEKRKEQNSAAAVATKGVDAPKSADAAPPPTVKTEPEAAALNTSAPEASSTTPDAAAPSAPSDTPAVTYDDVAKTVTKVWQADRLRVQAAFAKFGAKRGPDLKPEQWADFVKELS